MAEPEDNGPRWQVICSHVNTEILRKLQRRATRSGQGPSFRSALRQIVDRLQHDPTEVGEPLYRLSALRTQIRMVVVLPLAIDFAVYEDDRVVFIKGATLLGEPPSS